jgi:hypothetical protein
MPYDPGRRPSASAGPRRTLLPALASLVAALALSACAGTREPFSGDGVPVLPTGQHRHEVHFDPIRLDQPGEYRFVFGNLPTGKLHTLLSIDRPSPDLASELDQAGVSVRMSLTGATGDQRPPRLFVRSGQLEGQWTKTHESWADAPLEYVGMWFPARRHEIFILRIDVRQERPLNREIVAVPMVRGGPAHFEPVPAEAALESSQVSPSAE